MPKYILTLIVCFGLFGATSQSTHSVLVKVNQGPDCPIVSGLEEVENIKVFPNPVDQSTFTIQSEIGDAQVEILDLKGNMLLQDQLSEGRIEVDALNFKSGIYIINVIGRQNSYKMKIQIR